MPTNMFGTKLSLSGKVVEADFRGISHFSGPLPCNKGLRPYIRDSNFTFAGQKPDDNARTRDYSRAS